MRWQDHIEQRPDVMVGKSVVRGTRITVELILERLGGGAIQLYAAASLAADRVDFLEPSPG